ncbi:MAG: hypothetical protein FRX49_07853 [Trebouxia sp. A1-2]|nr:MAG: hypothetical protein FRX49_07853 [Trebouxia sp. A1-2]
MVKQWKSGFAKRQQNQVEGGAVWVQPWKMYGLEMSPLYVQHAGGALTRKAESQIGMVQQMQTGHAVSKSPHGALEMNNGCWKACQAAGQNWVAVCIGSAQQVYAVAADGQNTFVVGVVTADRVYQGRGWINIPALREYRGTSVTSSPQHPGPRFDSILQRIWL